MSDATPIPSQAEIAENVLQEMLRQMDFPAPITIETTETDEQIALALSSDEPLSALIGKGGQTLNAIELLVTLITRAKTGQYGKRMVIDAEGYRQQQSARIEEMAREAAQRVLDTGECVELDPMNARDRRVAHMAIAEIDGVASVSIGEEPHRCLVICLPGQEPLDA